ncbi:MAG: hypothetical protein NTV86_22365 [Planctomycetota bacterium]|nr:hypothetical protein [Planctomycetota bacterium]
MTEASPTPQPSTSPVGDPRFVLAAGLLLVVIIGMLAFLWLRERRTRMGLEADLARVQKGASDDSTLRALQGLMSQGGAVGSAGGVEAFSWTKDREGEPLKAVVDGRACMAVRITREAGERLGFRPGDVICVPDSAAGKPGQAASAPARATP